MDRNRNILMICYYFPPLKDVGCKRSVAFSKYLKKYGWNPVILTVKNPDKTYCSLGNEKPSIGVKVERSFSVVNVYKFFGKANGLLHRVGSLLGKNLEKNYFLELFCIPDIFWGWIPLTLIKAAHLIKRYDIDIVYVSCSPWSSAITGVLLRKLCRKPVVIDFRDPYGLDISWLTHLNSVLKLRRIIDRWLINTVLDNTDAFIVTTKETEELYCQQYPQVRNKICTIHNGFDTSFLPDTVKIPKFSRFTIIYTGEFYYYALKSEAFFDGLSILKKAGEINQENFQFLFYGDGKSEINRLAVKYNIRDLVHANGRIPYKDVLDALRRSHLQLLRIVKPMISTKLFEGIPLNVPFLATIPPGEVEDIIKMYSPSSFVVTSDSAEKIAEAIRDAMNRYQNNQIEPNRVDEFLERFSRERLTLKLIDKLERTIDGRENEGY